MYLLRVINWRQLGVRVTLDPPIQFNFYKLIVSCIEISHKSTLQSNNIPVMNFCLILYIIYLLVSYQGHLDDTIYHTFIVFIRGTSSHTKEHFMVWQL